MGPCLACLMAHLWKTCLLAADYLKYTSSLMAKISLAVRSVSYHPPALTMGHHFQVDFFKSSLGIPFTPPVLLLLLHCVIELLHRRERTHCLLSEGAAAIS